MKKTACLKGHGPGFAMRRFLLAETIVLAFLLLAVASLDAQDFSQHAPSATNLSCNAELIAPDNTYTPVFSWTFTDGDQPLGDVQTRYNIRVWHPGDSTDMWNLTDQELTTSTRMYAGLPLAPNTTYNWSVQVWDRADPPWPSPAIATASFVVPDIGLRVFDGTSTVAIVANAVNTADPVTDANRLRISKSGSTYSIALVNPTDPGASKIHVQIPSGTKALKKMVAPLPATGLSVGYLDFQGVWGSGTDPAAQSVVVTNVGGGTLDGLAVTVGYDQPVPAWLNVSPVGPAAAPVTLTVTASLSGFVAGTYTATVTVSSLKASNGPQEVKVSFTISAILPTVTTSAIGSITASTATGGGNVSSDGGAAVTARGVCWSTSQNPTTASSKTTDGTGTGGFSSSLTGLQASTFYYVRAYATNSVGTAYGDQQSFAYGQISDPTGDSLGTPDLIFASVTVAGGQATLLVRFASGTFDQHTTSAQFDLDTDQNPATGHPGDNAGGLTDATILGTDYIVNMGSDYYGTNADVMQYAGTVNVFAFVGNVSVTYNADGMAATVPLSMLGNDDGRLNFKVVCSTQVSTVGFTGVLDYMTNVGTLPGSTATP